MDLKRKWGGLQEPCDDVQHDLSLDLDAYNVHLQSCWRNVRKRDEMPMPWDLRMKRPDETGVLREGLAVTGQLPPLPAVGTELNVKSFASEDSIFQSAGLKFAKSTDERIWRERLSWERKCAYKKWTALVLEDIGSWEIGRQVATSGPLNFAKGGLAESIHDALGNKATATLHSRAGPLMRYVQFWKNIGCRFFPVTEAMVYDYLKAWPDAAPSAFRSLLLSMSFAYHLLGLSGGNVGFKSGRVKGLADVHFCDRRKTVQRPPLTVEQVTWLERVVKDESKTKFDRVAAGFFLLLVFGRLRFSDGLQITDMKVDAILVDGVPCGFLECQAERTKTSLTLERKTRLLPIAVPLLGFTDPCWVHAWLQVREECGLECKQGVPLLASPVQGGGWSKAPLPVGSGSDWLRALLKVSDQGPGRVATHSCKCTILSMCAKFGIEGAHRRMLGYHTHGKDKSLLIYSRDAMSAPLRKMVTMLEAVRGSKFFPDKTRSGYFAPDSDLRHNEPQSDSEGSDSSRGSESEEERDAVEEERVAESVAGTWAPVEENITRSYARHKTSRCIHAVGDEGGTHFKCGRMVTHSYVRLETKPDFMFPVCQGCFKV